MTLSVQRLKELALRYWPTDIGIETLMGLLAPRQPNATLTTRQLRGFPLQFCFNPQTYMGRYIYYRGMYEDGIIRKLARLLRPGMTFVDVGANAGLYTVIAAHVAGPSGHVLAIEPQPQLRALLERNLRLNRLSNVSIETIAVGRGSGKGRLYQVSSTNDGEATLRPSAEASSFDAPSLEVRIDTLSALVAKRGLPDVDGMKVDVEGGELDVLQGFEDQLASRPPRFIFYEGIDRHLARFSARLAELHGLFWTHGYTVYRLRYGGWHRVRAHPERKHVSGDFLAVHHGQSLRRRVGP